MNSFNYNLLYKLFLIIFVIINNGVVKSSSSFVSCVGIFRGSMRQFVGWFSFFLRVQSSIFVELMGNIIAIEQIQQVIYRHLWLESDSTLVCLYFSSIHLHLVPWIIHSR